ncbi:MAG: hypothetical protein J1F12_07745 [Muribaculaceae bacterium]|nr:hypothetical protein [Muribaculaceae bacterium]
MTAGLGIDAFTMAFNGNDVTAVELNPLKSKFLEYNAKVLGLQNFNVINADSLEVLKNSSEKFDVIFADPSRRNTENNRLYNLKDCIPDVISNQGLLLESANNVLIKASPLLDLSQTIRDFPTTTALYVVGVKGECKEILIYLNKKLFTEKASIDIFSIDLNTEGEIINLFKTERKKDSLINFPSEIPYINTNELTPGRFILEPSSLIMKIAPWKEICYKFKSKKFSPSSHLFLSDHKPDYFPGRVTRIEKLISKKDRKSFKGFPASVVSKNHPLSSEEIRKDWNLAEGNDFFIYASSIGKTKVFILTNNSQYFP